jgi:UDP-glucose:(glucosyl)LPS alpha-1,2-glucosyltransferase
MKLTILDRDKNIIETNELSKNARGGTELQLEWVTSRLPKSALEKVQIIPSRVRELDPNRKKILWVHDLPNDPEAAHLKDPESRKRFDAIVCVSHWQMQLYNMVLGVPHADMLVIQNAIPQMSLPETKKDKVRLVYHTTPHRGLEILVPVFEKLCEKHDNIELDVFSSFGVYGWHERDEPYLELFERCRQHPHINYHGAVTNEEIRAHLPKCDIFAYPSIWPETSCIAAIEAMMAGCTVVCPNYAALPETCANFATMYQFHEDKSAHARRFAMALDSAISMVKLSPAAYVANRRNQVLYFSHFYNIDSRVIQWQMLLKKLIG